MKFYKHNTGDTREIKKFALFPIYINGVFYWLEWVTIHQSYNTNHIGWNNDYRVDVKHRNTAASDTNNIDIWDDYWIVFKNGQYVSSIDEFGNVSHTKDENKAFKFYNFNDAMQYFEQGYCIIRN